MIKIETLVCYCWYFGQFWKNFYLAWIQLHLLLSSPYTAVQSARDVLKSVGSSCLECVGQRENTEYKKVGSCCLEDVTHYIFIHYTGSYELIYFYTFDWMASVKGRISALPLVNILSNILHHASASPYVNIWLSHVRNFTWTGLSRWCICSAKAARCQNYCQGQIIKWQFNVHSW